MNKCTDSFGEAAMFSASEINSSYWQVEVEETNRDKIAFTSNHGRTHGGAHCDWHAACRALVRCAAG